MCWAPYPQSRYRLDDSPGLSLHPEPSVTDPCTQNRAAGPCPGHLPSRSHAQAGESLAATTQPAPGAQRDALPVAALRGGHRRTIQSVRGLTLLRCTLSA